MATAKSRVNSSTSVVTGTASGATTDTTISGNTSTQLKALDFKTMQSKLGSAITLKFGGFDWTVVYATTNTTAGTNTKAGDLIVTLWLNDTLSTASQWNKYTSTAYTGNNYYPSNMYSTSFIRVSTLNAGGDNGEYAAGTGGAATYATSTTARGGTNGTVSLATRKNNQFAKFTLSNNVLGTGSLTQFLTMPKNVKYQEKENFVWSYDGIYDIYLCPNEAWGTPDTSLKHTKGNKLGGWNTAGSAVKDKPAYNEWTNDYLWLPSATEMGYDADGTSPECGASLWGIPYFDDIRKCTKPSLPSSGVQDKLSIRTSDGSAANSVYAMTHMGTGSGQDPTELVSVRPALHLNLSAIEDSVTVSEPQAPTSPYVYDGADRDLKNETWYNNNKKIFDNSSLCTVAYTNDKGVNVTPHDVGEYTATFTLGSDYSWAGTNTSKVREVSFEIEPKKLDVSFTVDSVTGLPKLSLTNTSQVCGTDTVNPVIRYYDKNTEDKKDLGTDLSKLKGNTQYYAYAEFDNKNYVPNNAPVLSFINPATAISVSWADDGTGNGGSKSYTGKSLAFDLEFDSDLVEIAYDGDAYFDEYNEFIATNVGTYTVNVRIKEKYKQDYCWGHEMGDAAGTSEDTTIDFEITPAVRKLEVVSITPSDWTVSMGGKLDATLDLQQIFAGTMEVMIYAKRTQNSKPIELCRVEFTTQQHSVQCELVTTGILATGTYAIGAQAYNQNAANAKNYSFVFTEEYHLTVEEAVQTGGILWRLYSGNTIAGSMTDDSGEKSTAWDKTITYTGKAYSFTVNPSGLGLTVDNFYGTNGYKTVKAGTSTSLRSVTDAGDYVTTVRLSNGDEYSIEWTIEKAKFDLSKVRWIDNGNLTYVAGGIDVMLDPLTIPAGLTPQYGQQTSAGNAGDSGTAVVTFTVADPDNYETPSALAAGSYIFTANGGLTDFEWSKDWTVSALQIPVNWTVGTLELESNNKKINVEVLAGGYGDYVTYLYYETNAKGEKLDPSAAGRDEPEITDNVIRYYIAEVQINPDYGTNCAFVPNANLTSPVFEVGRVLTAVQVEAKKSEYTYWGSPVTFLYNVKGAISSSAFEVSYYKGLKKLDEAPTAPGDYRAQLSLKSAYTSRYYLDGTYSFEFTIVRASISVSWNESVKPPVLNLTQDQSKYVTYEYRDSTGNTVSFNTLSSTPGVYDVIAKITDTSRYYFTGESAANETYTEWFEFEVKSGDKLTDPSTSLPAFTPSTDPNGDGSGTTSGKTPIWIRPTYDKVNGVQIENQFGWDNNAFTITYILDGRVVPNCNAAGTYFVEISLDSNSYTIDKNSQTTLQFTVETGDVSGGTTTTPDGNGGKDDGTGNNPSDATIVSYLPLILSGVSLVLIVVFLIMTLNNLSA
ncbi:MAG: hypothetical protein K2L02_01585, partial [Clostridia bacterium]|nr:hypothetical protein [Clostridia bacterium]